MNPLRDRRRCSPVLAASLLALGLLASACSESESQTYTDNVVGAMDRTRASDARSRMMAYAHALNDHLNSAGELPEADDIHELKAALVPAHAPRLSVTDPWGNEYSGWCDGSDYELASAGADGEWETEDDVVIENGQVTQFPVKQRK